MSGDLLIITPSRERPVNIARLLATVHDLRRLETHVHVCVDDDDPALEDYQKVFAQQGADGDGLITGPRVSFAAWTNQIALKRARAVPVPRLVRRRPRAPHQRVRQGPGGRVHAGRPGYRLPVGRDARRHPRGPRGLLGDRAGRSGG